MDDQQEPMHLVHEDDEGDEEKPEGKEATVVTKKPGSKVPGKKRTKSGCLTCRKRRIKCGEERPTCQNCTKSKRQCEGYNQRVVFKDPLSAYRPSWAGTSQMTFSSRGSSQRSTSTGQAQTPANPPAIAPKPAALNQPVKKELTSTSPLEFITEEPSSGRRQSYTFAHQAFPTPGQSHFASPESSHSPVDAGGNPGLPHSTAPPRRVSQPNPSHYDFNNLTRLDTGRAPDSHGQLSPLDWSLLQGSSSQQQGNEIYQDPSRRFSYQPYSSTTWQIEQPSSGSYHSARQDAPQLAAPEQARRNQDAAASLPLKVEAVLSAEDYDMIDDEDDPFDVSEDEMLGVEDVTTFSDDPQHFHLQNNDLGVVVALQASQDDRGLRMRSIHDFIDRPDMLATYAPSMQSSPLRDPMAARLFCHFVNVTAPIISMYERHPANPSLIFQGQPIPKSQQHIWTYVFPTLALQNSALLHAMLALASLHVSQLQNVPVTKSLKHYHISLRRVAKSLGNSVQRTKPATLAAAMLLSFYECWCADHQKWSNHLLGAKHLLTQIDFAGIAKFVKIRKQKAREQEQMQALELQRRNGATPFIDEKTNFQSYVEDVDENIVGMLMGKKLRYDQYGEVLEDPDQDNGESKGFSEKEIENYEIQRDIYWWYAKQDVIQSILGGGRLFLPYDFWSQCPPRAPIGRLNATYGTYDHLVLLMARVADFASKDLVRKRRAAKANGGWRPPEFMRGGPPSKMQGGSPGHMRGPPTPGSNPSGVSPSRPPPGVQSGGGSPRGPPPGMKMPQMPDFSGMLPGVGQAKLPMGFDKQYRELTPPSVHSDNGFDLEAERMEAEEEWQEIRNMFSLLADHFGEDFQPLGPEFSAPIQTPFGPALQYRTYGIAGIWMNYHMGLIACHRAHPSMPPAAMMAAGIAARQTAHIANEVGRIAAGIAPECSSATQVSPLVGAGLIESAVALFIAGVQYQDSTQRNWTVNRLRDISRLTGWETANAIATGCETSWIKTAEAGQGPPWQRTMRERQYREDIWATGRRVDRAGKDRDAEKGLVVARTDRVYYALGVLGLERDFERLEVEEERPSPRRDSARDLDGSNGVEDMRPRM